MQDAIRPEPLGMRQRLGAKLDELQRQLQKARAMMSRRTYSENPWLRLGVAAVIGYRLGCPAPTKRGSSETILAGLLQTVLVNVAISTMSDAIGKPDVADRPSSGHTWPSPRPVV